MLGLLSICVTSKIKCGKTIAWIFCNVALYLASHREEMVLKQTNYE